MKSISDYVFTLEGGAVTWRLAKETIIVRSIMKSKFVVFEIIKW